MPGGVQITDELRVVISAEVERAVKDMDRWDKSVEGSRTNLTKLHDEMEKASRKVMLFSTAMIGLGVGAIKAAGDIEAEQRALALLLGSAERGKAVFQDLADFASDAGLPLKDIEAAGAGLLNAGVGAGELVDTMRMLGDASQGKADVLDDVASAYGRIRTTGRATMEDLNRLSQANIPVLAALATQLGVSKAQLLELAGAGRISAADVTAAFRSMTSEGGQFHDALEKNSDLLAPKMTRALNDVKLAWAELGQEALPIAKDVLDRVSDMARWFRELSPEAKKTTVVMVGLGAAAGPVLKVSSEVIGLATNIQKLAPAMKTAAAALISPWGAIAAGIGGATVALLIWQGHVKQQRESVDGLLTAMGRIKGITNEADQAAAKATLAGYDVTMADMGRQLASLAQRRAAAQAALANPTPQLLDVEPDVQVKMLNDEINLIETKLGKMGEARAAAAALVDAFGAATGAAGAGPPPEAIKTWQEWWKEITGITVPAAENAGELAAAAYMEALEGRKPITAGQRVAELLGDPADLQAQMGQIRKDLEEAFAIDPKKINLPFSEQDDIIKGLVAGYNKLGWALADVKTEAIAAEAAQMRLNQAHDDATAALDILNPGLRQHQDLIETINGLWSRGALTQQQALAAMSKAWEDYKKVAAPVLSLNEAIALSLAKGLFKDANEDDVKKYARDIEDLVGALTNAGLQTAIDSFDQLGRAIAEGSLNAEDFAAIMGAQARAILKMLPMLFIQAGLSLIADHQTALGLSFIFGGIASAVISGFTEATIEANENALGNVYDRGNLLRQYAAGGVVSRPTLFPMANGTGLMGEAGPEAIMPLTRMPSGELGVQAQGGGGDVSVTVNNYSGQPVQTTESTGVNGERQIELTIGAVVDRQIAGGRFNNSLGAQFGLRAQGVRA